MKFNLIRARERQGKGVCLQMGLWDREEEIQRNQHHFTIENAKVKTPPNS